MLDYYIMTKRYGGKSRKNKKNKKGGFSFSGFADWVKSKTGLSTGSSTPVPAAPVQQQTVPPAAPDSSRIVGGKIRKKTKKTRK